MTNLPPWDLTDVTAVINRGRRDSTMSSESLAQQCVDALSGQIDAAIAAAQPQPGAAPPLPDMTAEVAAFTADVGGKIMAAITAAEAAQGGNQNPPPAQP